MRRARPRRPPRRPDCTRSTYSAIPSDDESWSCSPMASSRPARSALSSSRSSASPSRGSRSICACCARTGSRPSGPKVPAACTQSTPPTCRTSTCGWSSPLLARAPRRLPAPGAVDVSLPRARSPTPTAERPLDDRLQDAPRRPARARRRRRRRSPSGQLAPTPFAARHERRDGRAGAPRRATRIVHQWTWPPIVPMSPSAR